MLRRQPLQQLTIRAAVLVAVVTILGIWLSAGYYSSRRIAEVQREAEAINARYTHAQELLSTVRAQVLVASVYVRDALLDPSAAQAAQYRPRIDAAYRVVGESLDKYSPVLDSPPERARLTHLRREIEEFRGTMVQVLATDSRRWPAEAATVLRTRIVPKREQVIQVSDDLQALNRTAFVRQQGDLAQIYGVVQRRLWATLGAALVSSLAVGLWAMFYAGRLESRIQRQRLHDQQKTRDLQDLSAKVITAQEEERRHIARELHDEVGQVLTAIKVELAVAGRALEARGETAHLLSDARSITEGALATVRDLSHLLHPALLDDMGLASAVEWYLRSFEKRHGIRAEVLHDRMEGRLSREVETTAYRIVQEALTNVVKHARATVCRVYLQRLPHTILITVEDNGTGFDPTVRSPLGGGGLGLVGIRERAHMLRGTVRIESAAGKGTRLTVELPARDRAPAIDPESGERPEPAPERAPTQGGADG